MRQDAASNLLLDTIWEYCVPKRALRLFPFVLFGSNCSRETECRHTSAVMYLSCNTLSCSATTTRGLDPLNQYQCFSFEKVLVKRQKKNSVLAYLGSFGFGFDLDSASD